MEIIYTDKDGNAVKFTEEMAIAAITERDELRASSNDWQDRSIRHYNKLVTAREHVFEFFNSRYDSSSDEIECNVDEVNELLKNIGAEELKKLWTVTGSVNFTLTNVPASNQDEAYDYAMNELDLSLNDSEADLDDWTVDISDAEQQ